LSKVDEEIKISTKDKPGNVDAWLKSMEFRIHEIDNSKS